MNAIRFWNDVALEANRKDHSIVPPATAAMPENGGPTLSARALAMVQLAVHDAHFGAQGGAPCALYLTGFKVANPTVDAEAAVAAAASRVLRALYPKQAADFLTAYAKAPGRPFAPDAVAYGQSVADALLALRKGDVTAETFYGPGRRDDHREDPENPSQTPYGTTHGALRPFAIRSRKSLDDPRTLPSDLTANAVAEVAAAGGARDQAATTRTADQTVAAIYWGYDGANQLGTPPRLYNQILGVISTARKNTADQDARLFALANAAMADAGILAWADKYKYSYWRPVLGVREADLSTGPFAKPASSVCSDVFWRPLGAQRTNTAEKPFTPNFPAYPSGHATFGAAAFQAARNFYAPKTAKKADRRTKDDIAFEFVSDEFDGKATGVLGGVRSRVLRKFDSLWDAILENALSRLWLGVHWKFDAYGDDELKQFVGGVPLGLWIADDIFDGGLKQSTIS